MPSAMERELEAEDVVVRDATRMMKRLADPGKNTSQGLVEYTHTWMPLNHLSGIAIV